jgi:hypothetical protein
MIEAIAAAAHESRKVGVSTRGEAAIKFLFCYENGLPLSAANTGLYIVNGRIAAQSNIIAAQIRRHPDYDYRVKALDNRGCTIEILRRVDAEWRIEGEASFTEDDAQRAGLLSKDNYQGYPSDMYFNRHWHGRKSVSRPTYSHSRSICRRSLAYLSTPKAT